MQNEATTSKRPPLTADLSKMRKPAAFTDELTQMVKGDTIIYHYGEFAGGPYKHAAMAACEGGLVVLVQRRVEKGKKLFEYRAIRTAKRIKGEKKDG